VSGICFQAMRSSLLVLALSLAACSSAPPECSAIWQRCQAAVTAGTATTQEQACYDNARTMWTAQQCIDNLDVCQRTCLPPSGDH